MKAGVCDTTHFYWHQLLHPLCGNGYQFWSGIGSDFGEYSIATALLFGIVTAYRRHNCHVKGCPWLQWHVHPEHGHPVCKRHHPHKDVI